MRREMRIPLNAVAVGARGQNPLVVEILKHEKFRPSHISVGQAVYYAHILWKIVYAGDADKQITNTLHTHYHRQYPVLVDCCKDSLCL